MSATAQILDIERLKAFNQAVPRYTSYPTAPEWGTAGVTVANDANNRVVTGTGSGLNAEAKLTFDGTVLTIDGSQAGACVRSPIYENPKELRNDYSMILINHNRCNNLSLKPARNLFNWLKSVDAADLIKDYQIKNTNVFYID